MAFIWLFDWLTGQLVVVDAPTTGSVTPPTPSYFVPIWFILIPQ